MRPSEVVLVQEWSSGSTSALDFDGNSRAAANWEVFVRNVPFGAAYATGEWAGPRDLTEAAEWYRLAAE
jgi:TPR repeat protein